MCWIGCRWAPSLRALLLVLLCGAVAPAASAASWELPPLPSDGRQALLLTYGPGEIYWQKFGHNAIWLREPARGLDHNFNFGFFDFEQESFLRRFVQGRMLYFSAALPAERELAFYRGEGRSIRAQVLDLSPQEYELLRDHLLEQVRPENRDYLYDYYLDNCSTRLRDAIDLALGGALQSHFRGLEASWTFREHTRRATHEDYWYSLGLGLALGEPVDRPISQWDEMFLPAELADHLADWVRPGAGSGAPLVSDDRLLQAGEVSPAPLTPPRSWPRYLALSLAILAVAWLLARFAPPVLLEGYVHGWLLITGTLGVGLVLLWAFTDHRFSHANYALLLCSPVFVLSLWERARRIVAALAIAGAGLTGPIAVLAWPQYLADVWALAAPLNVAAAVWLWRKPPINSRG